MRPAAALAALLLFASAASAQVVGAVVSFHVVDPGEGPFDGPWVGTVVVEYCYGSPGAAAARPTSVRLATEAHPAGASATPSVLEFPVELDLGSTASCAPPQESRLSVGGDGHAIVTLRAEAEENFPIASASYEETLRLEWRSGRVGVSGGAADGAPRETSVAMGDESRPADRVVVALALVLGLAMLWTIKHRR